MMTKEEFFKMWDEIHAGIDPQKIKDAWNIDDDVLNYINSPDFMNNIDSDKDIINEFIKKI